MEDVPKHQSTESTTGREAVYKAEGFSTEELLRDPASYREELVSIMYPKEDNCRRLRLSWDESIEEYVKKRQSKVLSFCLDVDNMNIDVLEAADLGYINELTIKIADEVDNFTPTSEQLRREKARRRGIVLWINYLDHAIAQRGFEDTSQLEEPTLGKDGTDG